MIFIKRNAVTLVIILVLTVFVIELWFAPLRLFANRLNTERVHAEIMKAKSKWDSQGVTDYAFEVEYLAAPGPICHARVTVSQNAVVAISEREGLDENSPFETIRKEDWDKGFCRYSDFTVLNVFERLLSNHGSKLHAEFDPQYGFVTFFYVNDNVVRWCFSCVMISETGLGHTFSNFQRLDPSTP